MGSLYIYILIISRAQSVMSIYIYFRMRYLGYLLPLLVLSLSPCHGLPRSPNRSPSPPPHSQRPQQETQLPAPNQEHELFSFALPRYGKIDLLLDSFFQPPRLHPADLLCRYGFSLYDRGQFRVGKHSPHVSNYHIPTLWNTSLIDQFRYIQTLKHFNLDHLKSNICTLCF